MTEKYTPEQGFNAQLEAQQAASQKALELTVDQKLAWSLRANNDYATAAESRMKADLNRLNAETKNEIKRIRDLQEGEMDDLMQTQLLKVYEVVIASIQERTRLAMDLAVIEAPRGTADQQISTESEIDPLATFSRVIAHTDVQALVFQALGTVDPQMQDRYLEAVGRKFNPDFFEILKKVDDQKDFEEKDWELLVTEAANVGKNPDAIQDSQLAIVFAALKPDMRLELVQRLADANIPNFGEILLEMVASTYVSPLQATTVLNKRIAALEKEEEIAKHRDKKDIEAELEKLQKLLAQINGEPMKRQIEFVLDRQEDISDFYRTRTYGHKNRARDLLSAKGIGGLFLSANGALTIFANVAMNSTDPFSIPFNTMVWAGAAQMAIGMEVTDGHGGLFDSPTERISKWTKNEHETADDHRDDLERAFDARMTRDYREAELYARYAERIVTVYKAKKLKAPDQDVHVHLRDIGLTSREDLPPHLRDLWDNQPALESFLSKTVTQFSLIHGDEGIKLTEWDTQRKYLDDLRKKAGATAIAYVDLPAFEYKA